MRLYFKTGACSLSSRIILNELGLTFDAIKVDTEQGMTETGVDYRAINPKGYVPALELDSGAVLTETPAILQFLADHRPGAGLAPVNGTLERARLQEWLNFTSSELHKAFSPYFRGRSFETNEKERVDGQIARRIDDVERTLSAGRHFILGDTFSIADAYLFVVLNWSASIHFSLASWPLAQAYVERIRSRPSTLRALGQEGLLPTMVPV